MPSMTRSAIISTQVDLNLECVTVKFMFESLLSGTYVLLNKNMRTCRKFGLYSCCEIGKKPFSMGRKGLSQRLMCSLNYGISYCLS